MYMIIHTCMCMYMYIYIYMHVDTIYQFQLQVQLASAWQLGYHLEMIPSLRVWTECMHECMQETHAN